MSLPIINVPPYRSINLCGEKSAIFIDGICSTPSIVLAHEPMATICALPPTPVIVAFSKLD